MYFLFELPFMTSCISIMFFLYYVFCYIYVSVISNHDRAVFERTKENEEEIDRKSV